MKTDLLDIRHQDCMELMAEYPDKHFDLAIVDPPYGIGVNVNMGRRKAQKKSVYHAFAGKDKKPPEKKYFEKLRRVSKNQIVWGANHFVDKLSINSPCWLVWYKKFSHDVTFANVELAWTNFNTTAKIFIHYPGDKNRIHPTQKPVALYKWLLHNYAKPGDTILDTHLGSGSIAIACHYAKHHLTACELDKEYYDAACERIRRETAQIELF